MSEYPNLSSLVSAAGVPNFGTATKTGSNRTEKANEAVKELMLKQQLQRGEVIRVMRKCQEQGEYIPQALVEAIEAMTLVEISPNRERGNSPTMLNSTQNSMMATQNTTISAAAASVTTITNTHLNGTSNSSSPAVAAATTEEHVNATIGAIASGPAPPVHTQYKYTAKPMLDAIYQAHRDKDRPEEIRLLLEYLERGQKGEVAFDISASCRVFRQLGEAYGALGDLASAEHFLFDYYLTADKTGNDSEAARALMLLGKLFQQFGDLEKANEWFGKASARNALVERSRSRR